MRNLIKAFPSSPSLRVAVEGYSRGNLRRVRGSGYYTCGLGFIKGLGKGTEFGDVSAKQKVELWRHNANLVFKAGEHIARLSCLFKMRVQR